MTANPTFTPTAVTQHVEATASDGTVLFTLTVQETRVVRMIADGLSNKEIGDRLFLAEDTIKGYVIKLMRAMHARTRANVVHLTHLGGLFDGDGPAPAVMAYNATPLRRSYGNHHRADCALFRVRYCDCRTPEATVQEGHSR